MLWVLIRSASQFNSNLFFVDLATNSIQIFEIHIFFLISRRKDMLWYSLEAPHRGASYEYPQHVFFKK